jgi:hypothetical protein
MIFLISRKMAQDSGIKLLFDKSGAIRFVTIFIPKLIFYVKSP